MNGYILLSHGSKVQASNDASIDILKKLRENILNIELAFLELCEPNFEEAVKKLKAAGVSAITVLPLFLAPGKHVREDVPKLASACSKKLNIKIDVLEHIGANSAYVKMIESILLKD
ncbi:CbiX/SirB N-terminal domain-containing protein [Sulfurimonas sp.]|jgi:sirohydrochlorin cobaltochelatase|uniref:sirohydrochlorin chelatase n=1 Tax=Sulfurimonas sp. TaxID=2022749 RepID=UPI0025E17DDF|nr:CbiX/SirB N-terminal domain-containing protein [Sulfurimonas sp.]MCK9472344.1 CbiX/SirB N-terminal domain-containing protein [Sulfurimonas sp.]MDD3506119.1 CbiX/SirB N-terminal domain-containing protein [Sulfurimonas sp.]